MCGMLGRMFEFQTFVQRIFRIVGVQSTKQSVETLLGCFDTLMRRGKEEKSGDS